jgi:hypothetical protein
MQSCRTRRGVGLLPIDSAGGPAQCRGGARSGGPVSRPDSPPPAVATTFQCGKQRDTMNDSHGLCASRSLSCLTWGLSRAYRHLDAGVAPCSAAVSRVAAHIATAAVVAVSEGTSPPVRKTADAGPEPQNDLQRV